jgi:hypothetical protein
MDPGVLCGRSSLMLNDVVHTCQRLSATIPPDGWDDSKSTLQQDSVDKSKAVSTSRVR